MWLCLEQVEENERNNAKAKLIANRTPLERLTARVLELPDGYFDEPQAYGDYVTSEMEKAYQSVPQEGFLRRLFGWVSSDIRKTRIWKIYHVACKYVNIPTYEEREAYKALLADKARLDYLDSMMMDRMVTVSGNCCTSHASPHGHAYVHLNGIGYMPNAETMRGAIDNSMTASLQPVERQPLELQPL